jgi:hypothetical protein
MANGSTVVGAEAIASRGKDSSGPVDFAETDGGVLDDPIVPSFVSSEFAYVSIQNLVAGCRASESTWLSLSAKAAGWSL